MGTSSPRVSVVTIFLNEERFLAEAVESVLAQTYGDWELLLCDDGSSDGSVAIARRYAEEHPKRIRVLQHPGGENRGAAATRNLGIGAARGEYVAFLDGDDVWLPQKLEEQVALLDAHPEAGMVYGLALYWYNWGVRGDSPADFIEDGVACLGTLAPPPTLILRSYPLGEAAAPCPSDLLVRLDVLERVGGFETTFHGPLQMYEDQAFLAKVYLTTPIYVADRTWIKYRQHADSCVATVRREGQYEAVRRYYFEWLDHLLDRPAYRSRRVRRALSKIARPYRHPLRHACLQALSRPAMTLRNRFYRLLTQP